MTDSGDAGERAGGRESKVERVCREYGLEDVGEALAQRWRGDDGERESLRALADSFNRDVLAAALEDTGLRTVDGEVENLYRLLTDGDVSSGQRAEAEAKLERNGLDPGALRSDFVSHQAIHTYLTKHRGVEPPGTDGTEDRPGRTAQTIQRTRGRLRSVTEGSLSELANNDELTLGDVDVLVSVQVYCDDCGRQFDVAELIERGGCDCGDASDR